MKRRIISFDRYEIIDCALCYSTYRNVIFAAVSNKDIADSMVKVKSSNIWAYNLNVKNRKSAAGDLYVQFKGKNGGPGDVYVYYDVPVVVYRRWITAPSKGHYFWRYIRNFYRYSKLTGDKRTKLNRGPGTAIVTRPTGDTNR